MNESESVRTREFEQEAAWLETRRGSMRLSMLLGKTQRQPPADAHLLSHQLLVRAGYLRSLDAGLFAYLPLGQGILSRLQVLAGNELNRLGAQQAELPPVAESKPGQALVRLVGKEVDSYRQLPLLLFCTGSRVAPEPSARSGLFEADRRPAVEIHVFDVAGPALGRQVATAVEQIAEACGVPVVWAAAGEGERSAYYEHPAGDEELLRCPACGYGAQRSWAATAWPEPPDEPELPIEEVATPGCNTIATLAEYLNIPATQTLKMVFYSVEGRVTCAVIRGDRLVDEAKLARVLGTHWYYPSLEEELDAVGAVGGYASPIGLDAQRVRVVADPSVRSGKNLVSGANRPDYHLRSVNIPRDFSPDEWANLALIQAGDPCPQCHTALESSHAFCIAHGLAPEPCGAGVEYLDAGGRSQPLWMASWWLDLGRLMAAVVEIHHDEHGIVWPAGCAPFDVHLVALDPRHEGVVAQAEALYEQLGAQGFSVLLDDRDASAGVKFNDADLIGIPLRLTVSKRSVQEGLIEGKWRHESERLKLDDEGLAAQLAKVRGRGSPIF